MAKSMVFCHLETSILYPQMVSYLALGIDFAQKMFRHLLLLEDFDDLLSYGHFQVCRFGLASDRYRLTDHDGADGVWVVVQSKVWRRHFCKVLNKIAVAI